MPFGDLNGDGRADFNDYALYKAVTEDEKPDTPRSGKGGGCLTFLLIIAVAAVVIKVLVG